MEPQEIFLVAFDIVIRVLGCMIAIGGIIENVKEIKKHKHKKATENSAIDSPLDKP